jgi:hypothetical protein
MAQVQRHRRAIAAGLLALVAFAFVPALAQDKGPNAGTDLYDRPVLVVDPGMHTAKVWSQAVDRDGKYAVTGGADRTVRIWSIRDGKPLRTIWIPIGPEKVGQINAVAITPDGSTVAAGGWTASKPNIPIYIFDRESGNLVQRIHSDLPNVAFSLAFSPDGRYLAAGLGGPGGLRVFDRKNDWSETFRDDSYGDSSYGTAFAPDGHVATTSEDASVHLYAYDPESNRPNCRVSTTDQTLDHQVILARTAGYVIDEVVSDNGVSGVSTRLVERDQGKRLFDLLRRGDVLVVRWVDRLGRNYADVTEVIRQFMKRGIVVRTVINGLVFDGATKDPMQMAVRDALISFMTALSQAQAEAA